MGKENKKQKLGKGIRALLHNIEAEDQVEQSAEAAQSGSNATHLKIESLIANSNQPRKEFNKAALEELVASIKIHGLIQPITVRSMGDGNFQIISGERRYRASKLAGLEEVPVYIRAADDQELLEMALVENIQREDLNALEIAISLKRLIDECELTHENLASRVGKNRSTVSNYIRLLKLPPSMQKAVKEGSISMGHARALAGIENMPLQQQAFKSCIQKSLSVRALEKLIKDFENPKPKKAATPSFADAQTSKINSDLKEALGSKVSIKRNQKGAGQINIFFNSDADFNDLIDRLLDQ